MVMIAPDAPIGVLLARALGETVEWRPSATFTIPCWMRKLHVGETIFERGPQNVGGEQPDRERYVQAFEELWVGFDPTLRWEWLGPLIDAWDVEVMRVSTTNGEKFIAKSPQLQHQWGTGEDRLEAVAELLGRKSEKQQLAPVEYVPEVAVADEAEPVPPDNPAYKQDAWQNRSAGMTCATCVFYVPKRPVTRNIAAVSPNEPIHLLVEIGRCRRHAPTMNGYPAVYPRDWCGDHKVDENKVQA